MRHAVVLGVVILLGSPALASAQTATDDVVRALLERIAVLERRVYTLEAEARGPAPPAAAAAPAVPSGSPAPLRQELHDQRIGEVAQAE